MAKKKTKHRNKKLRNASGAGGGGRSSKVGNAIVDAFERTAVSAAGGAAASLIGGFAVSNDIFDPETYGLIATVGGAALASQSDSKWREAFNGAAAAGAGQLVLGYMAKRAIKGKGAAAQAAVTAAAQAPPPPPARQAADPGYVVQMFRDAAGGLDAYYDERARYADERARYADEQAREPDVVLVQGAA